MTVRQEAMKWSLVEIKHQVKYGRKIVHCENEEERRFIVDTVVEAFPYLEWHKVAETVMKCCEIMPAPRRSDIFFGVLYSLINSTIRKEIKKTANEESKYLKRII